MPVKRITNINISQRGLFTAIYGNWEDYFVDEDLKKYSLQQQLYLYLKNENYDIVLFYDTNNRFHSYSKTDLKKFLNLNSAIKAQETVTVNKVYRASHIKSPLHTVRNTQQAPKPDAPVNFDDDDRYIEVKHMNANNGFWKLRENVAEMYRHMERILTRNSKDVKSAIIIRSPGSTSFENQENYATLFNNIKALYDSNPELRNRIIIIYDCQDAVSLDTHFGAYSDMLFSNAYFYNIFISQRTHPVKVNNDLTHFIDLPDEEEINHIVQRLRINEKIPLDFIELQTIVKSLVRRELTTMEISKRLYNTSLKHLNTAELLENEIIIPLHIEIDEEVLTANLNKVIGQSEITPLITRKVKAHFNLRKRENPLSFLLIGTSGVGKTFTAELMAASLKKSGYRYVPLAMNLYQQEHDVNRLIGSATGFVGSETPPKLFEELEKSSRLVILFDEIEKAHEKVITALMQLLDKGTLSWNEKEGDFRDCILIFTSNAERDRVVALKNEQLKNHPGNSIEALLNTDFQNKLKDTLSRSGDGHQFRPEFCGRINSFLVYNPLKVPDLVQVAYEYIKSTALSQYDIQLNYITPFFLGKLASSFNESSYGLRDLKTVVKDQLSSLAEALRIDTKLYYQINDNHGFESQFLSPSNHQNDLDANELDRLFVDAIRLANELAKQKKQIDPHKVVTSLQSVKGQEDSFDYIADAIATWIRRKSKPLNFFFVGPSGVGKTETAKQITSTLSSQGYEIHIITCNKLAHEAQINEIIGSPPGYIGSNTEPELFRKHRLNNKLVIVFDEIEKAHPRIMINIMGLLDEGRLNWNNDERNFNNCIIIFTSNLEREAVIAEKQAQIAQGNNTEDTEFQAAIKEILLQGWNAHSLKEYHKPFDYPEVLGRIQHVLVFNELPPVIIGEIVVENIIRIVTVERQCTLISIDPTIIEILSGKFSNDKAGARPVIDFIVRDLNTAFDRSAIESEPGAMVSVRILNAGKEGKVKFKVELVGPEDLPDSSESNVIIPIVPEKKQNEVSAIVVAQQVLYDYCLIDTNIWLEDKLSKPYYKAIDTIAEQYKKSGGCIVVHGATYDEIIKFAKHARNDKVNIAARIAKKIIANYLKEEIVYLPDIKAQLDVNAFADKDLFAFAENEALAGKSMLVITNDRECASRIQANLSNLTRHKKIDVKYKVINGAEMLEMTNPLYQ